MTSKTLFGKLALAGCTLIAATTIGRAQPVMSESATAPVPGAYDVSQLVGHSPTLTTQPAGGFPTGFNYYWDASVTSPGKPGSTFTTGSNPGGYILKTVTVGTAAAGAGGTYTAAATYTVRLYSVTSATTNATLLASYANATAYAFVTQGDWLTMSGLSLPLAPNTTYAYTLGGSQGYCMLMYSNALGTTASDLSQRLVEIPTAGGQMNISTSADMPAATYDLGLLLPTALAVAPPTASAANPILVGNTVTLTCGTVVDNAGNGTYTYQWVTDGGGGGALTNIPLATATTYNFNTAGIQQTNLGNYVFAVKVTDSTPATITSSSLTVNVIQQQAGTLATGSVAPSPGATDAYQLNVAGAQVSGGLNYYTDAGASGATLMGQTFITGSNPKGYSFGSLAIDLAGGSSGGLAATNITYSLYLFRIDAGGLAQTIGLITNYSAGNLIGAYPTWVNITFSPITLKPNTTYGYGFSRGGTGTQGSVYAGLATSDNSQDWYTGGSIASFPAAGGAVSYGNNATADATFDAALLPLGVPFLLSAPTASPNPAYALSPVTLACRPTTSGPNGYTFSYQWFAEDDFNGIPSTPIPGATGTNSTVIPLDLIPNQPDFAGYTTNFYFVATDTTTGNSVTSSIVTLTVGSAIAPRLTDPTPASRVTFVGGSVTYTVGEAGTLPITNQWNANYGGGYAPLALKTSATLVLTNLQTTDSGSYQLLATNVVGHTNTQPVSLTVLADPAGPNSASQIYFNQVYTNNSWAYWRLNETGNPALTNLTAYDYSGHGFFSSYGSAATVNNAGPVPPVYPGFDAGELAAGTVLATANSYLTVPALHLNGNSNVTFVAWINPNGAQPVNAGLLFNRNGNDAAGFGFGNTSNLGYTWNSNSPSTYNWDSGLTPVAGQWNFVAYVITPTNTTVYMGNLNGGTNFYQSRNPVANRAETFNGGTTLLGGDSAGAANVRNFNGLICEAALFTNALTSLQVQQYFQAAIGAASLPPTLTTFSVSPTEATGVGVYSGQTVLMGTGNGSGTQPITNQWQVSADGSTWSDVAGGTNGSLLLNPQIVGTFQYHLKAGNIAVSVTSSPVTVKFNALPVTPPGLWTANFEYTNNISGTDQQATGGLGRYVGRGIVGNGMIWNMVPDIRSSGTVYNSMWPASSSALTDDGATSSGIVCNFNNVGGYNGIGTLASPYDIRNLTAQWGRGYGEGAAVAQYGQYTLQLTNVPAGTYNVVCYGGSGLTSQGSQDLGTKFIVVDSVNGNQTNFTAIGAPVTSLQQGVNFVVFTNVHSSGTINISVQTNAAAEPTETWGAASAVQVQLVSYDPPVADFTGTPTNPFVGQQVAFVNRTTGSVTNAVWNFGDGTSVTNTSNAGVNHSYAASGTYTVSLTERGLGGGPSVTNRTAYIVTYSGSSSLQLANVKLSNGSLSMSGVNGTVGQQYRILTSTNVALPFASWTPVWTSVVAPDGSYGYTNSSLTGSGNFYLLVSP
jgi:hypothetical protein